MMKRILCWIIGHQVVVLFSSADRSPDQYKLQCSRCKKITRHWGKIPDVAKWHFQTIEDEANP